ncbi:MAG: nucleotide-binding universal stress UspA family protein [Desulforhopalus sp.]|jgi:nucleotide-binding universal stress UspA family protein
MKNSPSIKTILYCSDLGGGTVPVFLHALAMAKQYDAEIIMVHVVEPMSDSAKAVIRAYLTKDITNESQKEVMKETLVRMKKRLKGFYKSEAMDDDYAKLVKKVHVVAGKPSEEILRLAEKTKADMIIMGKSTRKVRGIRVMGSTARRVSRMCKVPVLVVPNF